MQTFRQYSQHLCRLTNFYQHIAHPQYVGYVLPALKCLQVCEHQNFIPQAKKDNSQKLRMTKR